MKFRGIVLLAEQGHCHRGSSTSKNILEIVKGWIPVGFGHRIVHRHFSFRCALSLHRTVIGTSRLGLPAEK